MILHCHKCPDHRGFVADRVKQTGDENVEEIYYAKLNAVMKVVGVKTKDGVLCGKHNEERKQ